MRILGYWEPSLAQPSPTSWAPFHVACCAMKGRKCAVEFDRSFSDLLFFWRLSWRRWWFRSSNFPNKNCLAGLQTASSCCFWGLFLLRNPRHLPRRLRPLPSSNQHHRPARQLRRPSLASSSSPSPLLWISTAVFAGTVWYHQFGSSWLHLAFRHTPDNLKIFVKSSNFSHTQDNLNMIYWVCRAALVLLQTLRMPFAKFAKAYVELKNSKNVRKENVTRKGKMWERLTWDYFSWRIPSLLR